MHRSAQWLPREVRFLCAIYLLGLCFFAVFRFVLLAVNYDALAAIPQNRAELLLGALVMGWRFDTVISGYILALPAIVLSLPSILRWGHRFLHTAVIIYLGLFYSAAFLICSIDIPFFSTYSFRLTSAILTWIAFPRFMFRMVLGEISYWIYGVLFLALLFVFRVCLIRSGRILGESAPAWPSRTPAMRVLVWVIVLFSLFVGIRGRVAIKAPICVGTAFISNYSFINQLGLNPVYTLGTALLNDGKEENKTLRLMEDAEALSNVRRDLGLASHQPETFSIARRNKPAGTRQDLNVVIVLMESMSAQNLSRYGNPDSLTPNLDRIAEKSFAFDSVYSAGIHTYSGVFSTLFGFPTLKKQHPMNLGNTVRYTGLGRDLKTFAYASAYFTTHDDQFDNIGGFLRANGFDRIVSQKDYPSSRVLSTLGVPDHFLFEYSVPILNELSGRGRFLAVFLTGSNHGPYIIPPGIDFAPRSRDLRHQLIEYSDWALGRFLDSAAKQEWFHRTIFVLTGDHGTSYDSPYPISLSYHHIPLLFFAPGLKSAGERSGAIGGQIDIYPSVLGFLGLPFENRTMGIDLFHSRRPFICFNSDNVLGCVDQEDLLVIAEDGMPRLYRYTQRDPADHGLSRPDKVSAMRKYAFSVFQTTQFLMQGNKIAK